MLRNCISGGIFWVLETVFCVLELGFDFVRWMGFEFWCVGCICIVCCMFLVLCLCIYGVSSDCVLCSCI